MLNIIGLLILVMGFFLQYLIAVRIPSIPFFWLGGLLSLNKGIIIKSASKWTKWAQIGIIINIVATALMFVAHFLIGYGSITTFEYYLEIGLYWLASPATAIGQQIFPYPETHHVDGSVSLQISYSRSVITTFLNVAVFALISTLIGMFWKRTKKRR